jgi:hypothetical protein
MTVDGTFALIADDTSGSNTIHIITFRNDEDWELGWNVANCGESFDDYALVSFANTEGGYPLALACGRCFEALGSDLLRAKAW